MTKREFELLDCIYWLLFENGYIKEDGEYQEYPVLAFEEAGRQLTACGWITQRTVGHWPFRVKRPYFDSQQHERDRAKAASEEPPACPECAGSGRVKSGADSYGDLTTKCPDCHGTGERLAVNKGAQRE